MHHEVETAPFVLDLGEDVIDTLEVENVATDDDLGADRLGQRHRAAPKGIALVGEGQLRAMTGQHAGNSPGDRAVVGHAHDEAAFARHQWPGLGHILVRHDLVPLATSAGKLPGDKPPTCPSKTPDIPAVAAFRVMRRIASRSAWHWYRRNRSCLT